MPQGTWPLRSPPSRPTTPARLGIAIGTATDRDRLGRRLRYVVDDAEPTEARRYQSLYRRFRPQRFDEVRGQDHVALALRNAVRDDRIGHAYLFSGPRGTGKTSTARILGKGAELHRSARRRAVRQLCLLPVRSPREPPSTSTSSTPPRTTASTRCATSSLERVARDAWALEGLHRRRSAHALDRSLERAVEDPRGATRPRRVRAGDDRPAKGAPDHPQPDAALRVPPPPRRDARRTAGRRRYARPACNFPTARSSRPFDAARGSARDALSVLDQVAASGMVEPDTDRWLVDTLRALSDYDQSAVLLAVEEAVRTGRDAQQLALDLIDRLRVGFLSLVSGRKLDSSLDVRTDELELLRGLGTRAARAGDGADRRGRRRDARRPGPANHPRGRASCGSRALKTRLSLDALTERIDRLERRIEHASSARGSPLRAAPAATAQPPGATDQRPQRCATPPEPTTETSRTVETAEREPGSRRRQPAVRPALGAFSAPARRLRLRVRRRPPPPSVAAQRRRTRADRRRRAGEANEPTVEPSRLGVPSLDALRSAWQDSILGGLRLKVRAIFQAGRFVEIDDGVAVLRRPERRPPVARRSASPESSKPR